MKAHVGVDTDRGIVHSRATTTAKVHDSRVWNALLHGGETSVRADKGHVSAARATMFRGPGTVWRVMRKAPKCDALHPIDRLVAAPLVSRTCGATTGKCVSGACPFRVIVRHSDR